jgi:hypothetical protein
MKRIHIPKKLYDEIIDYCVFNNIKDINKQISSYIEMGFNYTKYGYSPFGGIFPSPSTNEREKDRKHEPFYDNKEIKEKNIIIQNETPKKTDSFEQNIEEVMLCDKNEMNNMESNPQEIVQKKTKKKGITIIKN